MGSILNRGNEFLFLQSGVEAKCVVEYRLSSRNAFINRRKMGNDTSFPYVSHIQVRQWEPRLKTLLKSRFPQKDTMWRKKKTYEKVKIRQHSVQFCCDFLINVINFFHKRCQVIVRGVFRVLYQKMHSTRRWCCTVHIDRGTLYL